MYLDSEDWWLMPSQPPYLDFSTLLPPVKWC